MGGSTAARTHTPAPRNTITRGPERPCPPSLVARPRRRQPPWHLLRALAARAPPSLSASAALAQRGFRHHRGSRRGTGRDASRSQCQSQVAEPHAASSPSSAWIRGQRRPPARLPPALHRPRQVIALPRGRGIERWGGTLRTTHQNHQPLRTTTELRRHKRARATPIAVGCELSRAGGWQGTVSVVVAARVTATHRHRHAPRRRGGGEGRGGLLSGLPIITALKAAPDGHEGPPANPNT